MPVDFRQKLEQSYLSTHFIHFMPQSPGGWAWVMERLHLNFGEVLASLSRESRILDAPCGVGYFEHYLLKEGFTRLDCVDLCGEQLDMAKQKLTEFGFDFGGKARFILADLFKYLKETEPYDAIIVIDFLEHLKKDQIGELLILAHSALRPGGVLLLRSLNADNPMFSQYLYVDFTHEMGFTPSSMRQCLEVAGFKIEKLAYEKVGPTEKSLRKRIRWKIRAMGLRIFARLIGVSPAAFTENLIAVARK